jgi:phosphoribosylanthranilate isomerase
MSGARAKAKICGLTTTDAVRAALDGGASYLGFVFFPKSPRNLTPDAAARLAEPARGRAGIVAVTVDPDDELLDHIARTLRPDLIQLHGGETPARAAAVRLRTGALTVKAIPISTVADLDRAKAYDGAADHLMLDAKPAVDAPLPGGNGTSFDWSIASGRRFGRPWFLAGGLDPWNVNEAVSQSGATLVDVSSGVERGPGYKDPRLISAFLDAVRRA